MELIQNMVTETLTSLALGVLSLLAAYGVFYIHKAADKVKEQTRQLKDEQLRKQLDNALGDVEMLSTVTIGAIEQTTARQLREAVKDGKTDREELVALSKQAFEEIRNKVTPQARKVITENLGSFDEYLSNLIETKVLEVKAGTGW